MAHQRSWVQIHHYLSPFASIRKRNGCTLYGGKLTADKVVGLVEENRFTECFAVDAELQNRYVRGARHRHERWRYSRRQIVHHGVAHRSDHRHGLAEIGALMQEDLDDAQSAYRTRLDVLNAVDRRCQPSFRNRGNQVFNVLRRHSGVGIDAAYDRYIDTREYVHCHLLDRQYSEYCDGQRHYDECMRSSQGQSNDPHITFLPLKRLRPF